jgi:hypothetical protein
MDKDQVEEKLRRLGLKPISREKCGDFNLYIGETDYSSPPHLSKQKRGIKPEDFPFGLYETWFWWGKDEKLLFGSPSFYCALNTTQKKRVDDTKARAQMDLLRLLNAEKKRRGAVN